MSNRIGGDMPGRRVIGVAAIAAVVLGCTPSPPSEESDMSSLEKEAGQLRVDLVSRGRILFSHHSVGRNILEGARSVLEEAGFGSLNVIPLEESASREGPALIDASGGTNGDPLSKIEFFVDTIRSESAGRLDMALMKLCYVDFNPRTDVDALVRAYADALNGLKRDYPQILFAHATSPLTTRPSGWKPALQRMLGREVWEDASNVKRWEYNRKLREAFPSDPLFDIAALESAGVDGKAVVFRQGTESYPALDRRLSSDGGHLNEAGRRRIGAEFLRFLAGAPLPGD